MNFTNYYTDDTDHTDFLIIENTKYSINRTLQIILS